MTGDAKLHVKIDPLDPIHALYRPVALLALNLIVDMALMIEQDMFGQVVDLPPRRRRFRIKVPVLFSNPGMIGDDIIVTIETLLHRRNSGKVGTGDIGVAELTLYVFNTGMQSVAERDGLFRTDIGCRRHVEVEEEKDYQQKTAAAEHCQPFIC